MALHQMRPFTAVEVIGHCPGQHLAIAMMLKALSRFTRMTRKPKTPKTIDEYLAELSDAKRKALQQLRKTIKAAAPKAEECISYQIPAFRHNGMLVGFGAASTHCAFYLMSSSAIKAHQRELKEYDTSKGTIRFQPNNPLPAALVRKLVKARIAENGA